MATVKTAYGATTALTITLANLASGSARESAGVDNSSDQFLDVALYFEFVLAAGVPGGVGGNAAVINIYASLSVDGSSYSEPATGLDAAVTLQTNNNLRLIDSFYTPTDKAGSAWKCSIASLGAVLGFVPVKWGVVIDNQTGQAFQATGQVAKYRGYQLVSV